MGYPITMGGGFIIGMSLPAFDTLMLGYKSWICLFLLCTDFLLWEKCPNFDETWTFNCGGQQSPSIESTSPHEFCQVYSFSHQKIWLSSWRGEMKIL